MLVFGEIIHHSSFHFSREDKDKLVGGFNPTEKYARQIGFIFPNFRVKIDKYLSCHHLLLMVQKSGEKPVDMVFMSHY